MTDYDLTPLPLTKLPLRKFEHFRVSTRDAPPVLLGDSNQNNANATKIPCVVCHDHVARYTCPRCETPYCSIACYQAHNDNNAGDSSCTEGFYQERVQSVVQLEQKAKAKDTLDILNRTHNANSILSQEQILFEDEDDDDDGVDTTDLLELLSVLEQTEEGEGGSSDGDKQWKHISSLLAQSPKLKAAFEAAVQAGDLQKLVLKSWDPWWRPIIATSTAAEVPLQPKLRGPTLDERLLKVKPLEALLPKGRMQIPNLTYNLLDVLYSVVLSFRLYHGVDNVLASDETAVEAALTMAQESLVLSQDARYECLEEALMTKVNGVAVKDKTDLPHWTLVVEDVALLVKNQRYFGRAILEALDIFKAAIASLKKCSQQEPTTQSPDIADLRRKRKKLEFYLSWSQHPGAAIEPRLSDEIRAWADRWKMETTQPPTNDSFTETNHLQAVVQELLGVETQNGSRVAAASQPKRQVLITELD